MSTSALLATVRLKSEALAPSLHEEAQRRWAAGEPRASGRGGISLVATATGLSRPTLHRGLAELNSDPDLSEEADPKRTRIRRTGGGRPRLATSDRSWLKDLHELVDPATRGDPRSPLLRRCKSPRHLARALGTRGHQVRHRTGARLLVESGSDLRANRKTQEGKDHPDRDAQSQPINRKVRSFQRRGPPVVSVDTEEKERVGNSKDPGQGGEPKGQPRQVKSKDFPDKRPGEVAPYGVDDQTADEGGVDGGITHDPAEFAVESIRRRWSRLGHQVDPEAGELLVTADSGGSDASRSRLGKVCLQELAEGPGLKISVCPFPPGTSQWNRIEHRMFCPITEDWRGRPSVSQEVVVDLLGGTRTRTGLRIQAELDTTSYAKGIKVTNKEWEAVRLKKDKFHGEWNDTILPYRK